MELKLKLFLSTFISVFISLNINSQTAHRIFQTGHSSVIENVIFNNDGKFIASSANENYIIIWEVESGKQFAVLNGHNSKINALIFNPKNSDQLISCSDDSTLIVWDYKKGEEVSRLKASSNLTGICFSTCDSSFYVSGNGLLKVDFVNEVFRTKIENSFFNAIAVDDSGHFLLSSVTDNKIKLFELKSNAISDYKNASLNRILFSKMNNCFYGVSINSTVLEITYQNNKIKLSKYLEQGKKLGLNAIAETEHELFCAGGEQNIFVYSKKNFSSHFFYGHTQYISALAINQKETIIASASGDNTIILWDKKTYNIINTLKGNYEQINALKFSKNNEALIIAKKNASLKYWELKTNIFYNTTIPLKESKKRLGWKNTIVFIDSANTEKAYICYVEYLPAPNSNNIKKAIFYSGIWNYSKNTLDLIETNKKKYQIKNANSINNQNTLAKLIKAYKTEKKSNQIESIELSNFLNANDKTEITDFDYNLLYDFYAISGSNGTISFLNNKVKSKFLINIGLFNTKDFLFSDNANNYYGTKEAISFMNIRYNSKLYNISQLDVLYNRPDIILERFPFVDKNEIPIIIKAVENRRKKSKLSLNTTPEDILKQLPEIQSTQTFDNATGLYTIKSTFSSLTNKIKKVVIKINGVPVEIKEVDDNALESITTVELTKGTNYIEVTGVDKNDLSSLPTVFSIVYNDSKKINPTLYLIGISASEYKDSIYNLNYASKDVEDLTANLKANTYFKEVKVKTFHNKFTQSNLILDEASEFLKNVEPNDVVILFYAGHGVLDENYNYYLGTYDMDFNNPKIKALAYENVIQLLDKTKSRNKLCLIDACHSGEIDKDEVKTDMIAVNTTDGNLKFRAVGKGVSLKNANTASAFELSKQLFTDIKQTNGTIVISASGGLEYAIESNNLKNGIFTFALLEAINQKKADYNFDGKISVKEIELYLPNRVSELTNGKQKANSRTENNLLNFNIH
jgi:WD40 repeat protein